MKKTGGFPCYNSTFSACFMYKIVCKIVKMLIFNAICGERGIRTPGASRHAGFQDRCNRPLYHLSLFWSSILFKCGAKVQTLCEIAKSYDYYFPLLCKKHERLARFIYEMEDNGRILPYFQIGDVFLSIIFHLSIIAKNVQDTGRV